MSKSLGNFFTVREVLKESLPEVVRFFILSSHYRSPLNYSQENLEEAKAALSRLYTALRDANLSNEDKIDTAIVEQFDAFMNDDFNTPKSIALLHELARDLNKQADKQSEQAQSLAATLKHLGSILGLLQDDPKDFLQAKSSSSENQNDVEEIEALIAARAEAKATKDYGKADEIRDKLNGMNISLEDTPQGTIWRRN